MKNTLRINHYNRTIVMDRTFAKYAANTFTEEYAHLQQVRRDYPTYQVVQRHIRTNDDKKTYKGLTYEYMEDYIMTHGTEETRLANYKEYAEKRVISECHGKAFRYPVIKSWFLAKYPEIMDFGEEKDTTIVEVGVDIPDADIMVIASPERFGLATLHQLRGRIGRDGSEAHCFCLSDSLNEKSYERISFFKAHTNGFEIAEYDLKQRGSGSLVGTNQHGVDNGLFSRFTEQSYATAKEILDWLKKDQSLFVKVLEIGKQTYDNDIYGKIVFN